METKRKKIHNLAALGLETVFLAAAALLLAGTLLFPSGAGAANREGGFLAKTGTAPTVYFISANHYKLAIPSARVFLSYRYKWSQVGIISESELSSYLQARYISENSSAAIYFLDGGGKRYVTQASAAALGIRPEEVISVNRTEFRSYALGARLEEPEAKQLIAAGSNNGAQNLNATDEKCVPDPAVGGEDGCVIYEASVKNDPALCSAIKDNKYLPSCYAMFEAPAGRQTTFYCDKILDTSLKETCIGKVAVRKKDPSLCSGINTKSILNECLAGVGIVSGDLDKCNLLPVMTAENQATFNQDACIYMFAITNSNTAACEKMPKGSAYHEGCVKYSKPFNVTQ